MALLLEHGDRPQVVGGETLIELEGSLLLMLVSTLLGKKSIH